jgi:glycosyltransferase involved in cell wall biosynthesis
MIAHNGIKGVTSSKLFEYFSVQRPIIVFPNDNDVLETLVKTTQTGFVCNDAVELYDALAQLIHQFEARGITHSNINEDELFKYSRKNQCQILANAIISDGIEG